MAVEEEPQPEISEWIRVQAKRFRRVRNAKKSVDPGIHNYQLGPYVLNRDAFRRGMDICYKACEMDLMIAVTPDGADMIYAEQVDAETGELRRYVDSVGKKLALKIASGIESTNS